LGKRTGRNFDGPHPNRIGYNHIAKLISETIISKKII
jgi:hypothetical protein